MDIKNKTVLVGLKVSFINNICVFSKYNMLIKHKLLTHILKKFLDISPGNDSGIKIVIKVYFRVSYYPVTTIIMVFGW